jgi:thioredoxin-like negative regulator of GroEL
MTRPSPRIRRAAEPASKARSTLLKWAAPAPALLTMLGVVLFAVTLLLQQSSRIEARYRELAANSIESGDYTTSRLCYERLLQTHPNDPPLLYGLARSLDGLHQPSESFVILQSIAPPDTAGYPPAHLMQAEMLLASKHTDQTIALAEKHLRRVLDADPGNVEAISFLAGLQNRKTRPQ